MFELRAGDLLGARGVKRLHELLRRLLSGELGQYELHGMWRGFVLLGERRVVLQLRRGHLSSHARLTKLLQLSRGDLRRDDGQHDVAELLELPDGDLRGGGFERMHQLHGGQFPGLHWIDKLQRLPPNFDVECRVSLVHDLRGGAISHECWVHELRHLRSGNVLSYWI